MLPVKKEVEEKKKEGEPHQKWLKAINGRNLADVFSGRTDHLIRRKKELSYFAHFCTLLHFYAISTTRIVILCTFLYIVTFLCYFHNIAASANCSSYLSIEARVDMFFFCLNFVGLGMIIVRTQDGGELCPGRGEVGGNSDESS